TNQRMPGTANHSDFAVRVERSLAGCLFFLPSPRRGEGGKTGNPQRLPTTLQVPMSNPVRSRPLELFKQRAFCFGNFPLPSGKKSNYYINSKKAIFHSESVALLGELLWQATKDLDIQAMGGLEVGAIPMAAAAAMRYHQAGRTLEGFFVRKQAKAHGSQER